MAEVRFYLDECVKGAVATGLRRLGIDVLTVSEAGLRTVDDDAVHVRFAHAQGLVIFTQDTDFLILAAAGVQHSGIVYATQRARIGQIISGLADLHGTATYEDLVGKVMYL